MSATSKELIESIAEKARKSLSDIVELKKVKAELRSENAHLSSNLQTANSALHNLDVRCTQLQNSMQIVENNLRKCEMQLTEKQAQIDSDIKLKSDLLVKIKSLDTLNEQLESKNAELISEMESARQLIADFEKEIVHYKEMFEVKKKTTIKKK